MAVRLTQTRRVSSRFRKTLPVPLNNRRANMAATKKAELIALPTEEAEGMTLEQALTEEGEGRPPESLTSPAKKADGPSKMDRAIKIMQEMWDDLQAGKVGERSLRRALREYSTYYLRERNHQGVNNQLLAPYNGDAFSFQPVQRRQRLGGMLSYYHREAA